MKPLQNPSATTDTTPVKSQGPKWRGTVVSIAMEKTIVVAVDTFKQHPKYQKRYRSTKKYKVHAPEKRYALGDTVIFRECRPLSRGKHHVVVS